MRKDGQGRDGRKRRPPCYGSPLSEWEWREAEGLFERGQPAAVIAEEYKVTAAAVRKHMERAGVARKAVSAGCR